MEEETMSSTMTKKEASDLTSLNSPSQRPSSSEKPNKQNGGGSSRFKGVVYQQNGHWGAQIYANHRRIWLGTFKTEMAAATAYDSAAIKLRQGASGEAHRNFPWTNVTAHEPKFQASYTTDQVLNMIKDGSYQTKFDEYLASISQSNRPRSNSNQNVQQGLHCQELFRKELTPSDVGKLNRLVIPKRHALKYFPDEDNAGRRFGASEGEYNGEEGGDMELIFYDNRMKSWKFRYCYWKSSQSFVFTRGWNKFVKEKNLEANDIVIFYLCELRGNNNYNAEGVNYTYWMIDIVKKNDRGQSQNNNNSDSDNSEGNNEKQKGKALMDEGETSGTKKNKGLRLFGVQVVPANSDDDESSDEAS